MRNVSIVLFMGYFRNGISLCIAIEVNVSSPDRFELRPVVAYVFQLSITKFCTTMNLAISNYNDRQAYFPKYLSAKEFYQQDMMTVFADVLIFRGIKNSGISVKVLDK